MALYENPAEEKRIAGMLHEAGMKRHPAGSLAKALTSIRPKELDEHLVEGVFFFAERGILLNDETGIWMNNFIKWRKAGGSMEDIQRREVVINEQVCWRPSVRREDNTGLLGFLKQVKHEFVEDHHTLLGSFKKPPTKLAESYRQQGVKYASRDELRHFLQDYAGKSGMSGSVRDFLDRVVGDLPRIITEADVDRYVKMLSNPPGGLAISTHYPMKFAVLPDPLIEGVKGGVEYAIALIPESRELSERLQKTRFPGYKHNNIPGALAFTRYEALPTKTVLQREIHSDYDTEKNRCFGVEDWPDLLREAMHVDAKGMGVEYSLVPKLSYAMEAIVHPKGQFEGMLKKLERAYGRDDRPPKGYGSWGDVKPSLRSALAEFSDSYWIRRL
jgi:hypothetical protein